MQDPSCRTGRQEKVFTLMYHLLFCWGLGVYIFLPVWGLVPAGNRAPGDDPAAEGPAATDPPRLKTKVCIVNLLIWPMSPGLLRS